MLRITLVIHYRVYIKTLLRDHLISSMLFALIVLQRSILTLRSNFDDIMHPSAQARDPTNVLAQLSASRPTQNHIPTQVATNSVKSQYYINFCSASCHTAIIFYCSDTYNIIGMIVKSLTSLPHPTIDNDFS